KEKPEFRIGIKCSYAIQVLLLYGAEYGAGLDSSYRHKNENRAPVTFLTTTDENERMVPGLVFISGDVTTETLILFLATVKELVEDVALDIVGDPTVIDGVLQLHQEKLIAAAHEVVETGDWVPLFFMIDKCRAEYHAILHVWPEACIRLCQFHVIQSIIRWEDEHGDPESQRPSLKRPKQHMLLYAFRGLQRAYDEETWDTEKALFLERIRTVILPGHKNRQAREAIIQYFERNWFTAFWRDLWTDIGLPPGHNCDRISTNNFTERAFKTFDQIFLDNRANKSIFRLILIIANEWFEYYRQWHPTHAKPPNKDYLDMWKKAYDVWDSGAGIVDMGTNEKGQCVWRVAA
ncbi:hypothetical protein K435DRAFT_886410, partial [Dendrothele bispora CBS 962.96]